MPKRGKNLLAAGRGERAEPIVTYSRLSPEETAPGSGRIEPHFTAVRLDRRGRPVGTIGNDDIDSLPLVDAPVSGGSFDPVVEVGAGEIRPMRRRGPGVLALAGVLALVAGAGVLAAVYNGVASLDTEGAPALVAVEAAAEPTVVAATEPAALAPVDTQAVDATGRSVRVVSADKIPPPFAETAALTPGATADPAAGSNAAPNDAQFSGEAALAAEPPGRVIADPPPPRLRPATASFTPPQSATPESEAMAAVGPEAAMPAAPPVIAVPVAPAGGGGSDVDAALASVDRILAGQQPAGDYGEGSGDGEFYEPVAPLAQPLPYPVLEPLANDAVGPAYPAGEPYGPYYPGQEPYAGQPVYPNAPQPLQPGVDLAADVAPAQPWWLPKRRALIIPNAPVPPAEVPNAPGGAWGAW